MGFAAAAPIVLPMIMSALYSGAQGLQSGDDDMFGDIHQQSLLTPAQRKIERQRQRALSGRGGKGAFGQVADYYRDLMEPNSQSEQGLIAPEMRNFNENIIPGLSEQFAGMGAGNLSSSGFRNAAVGAGTDLSERLGAIRANLRQQGAQGLANMGNQSLTPTVENLRPQPQSTFGENFAEGVGQVAPQLAYQAYQNYTNQAIKQNAPIGKQSSWKGGGGAPNAPMPGPNTSGKYNLPTFGGY